MKLNIFSRTVAFTLVACLFNSMSIGNVGAADKELNENRHAQKMERTVDQYDISLIMLKDKARAEALLTELQGANEATFSKFANKEPLTILPNGNLGPMRLDDVGEAFHEEIKRAAKQIRPPTYKPQVAPVLITMLVEDPEEAEKKVEIFNILMVKRKETVIDRRQQAGH